MNPFGRSAQEQRAYEDAFYTGTQTLKNLKGIRDPHTLERAERLYVAARQAEGLPNAAMRFDVLGLRAIHQTLFQDLYPWAGEFRAYTTGRGSAPFARPEHIEPQLQQLMRGLTAENTLRGLSADDFAARADHYVNAINAAHPFIDGNGRAQRVWLRLISEQAGHPIVLRVGDEHLWNEASKAGFYVSDDRMADLLRNRIDHDHCRRTLNDRHQNTEQHAGQPAPDAPEPLTFQEKIDAFRRDGRQGKNNEVPRRSRPDHDRDR